jgi:hypothetical protein
MSQHDFDIANQTAPNTRADLNLALKALASTSSGASAPATTYANMIYYNTSDNKLYKRNEADSGWISLGVVDESLGTFTPSNFVLASQAEAEVGANNTKVMTPLRVSQAIAEQSPAPPAPTTLVESWTVTAVSSKTFSGLDLTPYKFIKFAFDSVVSSFNGNTVYLNSGTYPIAQYYSDGGNVLYGYVDVDLSSGMYVSTVSAIEGDRIAQGARYQYKSNISNASTSIIVGVMSSWTAGGTIKLYGIR